MERNLLEREIAALNRAANSFTNLQLASSRDAEIILYSTKFPGKLTETSFLRKEDLKTKQIIGGKQLYYLSNQQVEVLGENDDWFLVEGEPAYWEKGKEKAYLVNNSPVKLQGWIKKSWVIYKIPPKLDEEPKSGAAKSKEYTCYVEIDLNLKANKNNKAWLADKDNNYKPIAWALDYPESKTAIYVPDRFKPDSETDMIIYLHGHLKDHPGMIPTKTKGKFNSPSIQHYLNYSKEQYFNFRKIINNSQKNIVFVAPTLGPRSQYGNLARNFDNYIDQVIWAINEYIFRERQLEGKLNLRNLIIAAHSGGGTAMLDIAQQPKSIYVNRIKSYWGFDSWYNGTKPWNEIAETKSVQIYAYENSSHNLPKARQNVSRVLAEGKLPKPKHFTLLPYYFKERLLALDFS